MTSTRRTGAWIAFAAGLFPFGALASPPDVAIAAMSHGGTDPADLVVTPRSVAIRQGEVARIASVAGEEVTRELAWVGFDEDVVRVEYGGHVVGMAPGTTTVRPVRDGVPGRPVRIEVAPSPVVSMLLEGVPSHLEYGDSIQLRAVAYRQDLSVADVTREAVWTSSDPAVVEVDASGRISVVGEGACTVDAWIDGQVARSGRLRVYAPEVDTRG